MIEGDGIGREVIPAAIGVIRRLELGLEFQPLNVGAERYLHTGEALPEEDFAQLETADAILLGAIGDPRITDPRYSLQTLGRIRRELDLYANVRPARLLCGRLSPLRDPGPRAADIIVVRENTEGLYSSLGGRFKPGTADEMAMQEHVSTFRGVTRILDYAFSVARSSVVLADKWQAMPHAGALWQRCWRDARAAHPDTPARHMAIDACALHMISDPWQFDVVVTENCFGDILSDIAGASSAAWAWPRRRTSTPSPAARCSSPCTAAPPTSREPGPPTRRPRSWPAHSCCGTSGSRPKRQRSRRQCPARSRRASARPMPAAACPPGKPPPQSRGGSGETAAPNDDHNIVTYWRWPVTA